MLRPGSTLRLESRLSPGDIVTCLPVIQEVLQGIREEGPYRNMRETMYSFVVIESPLTAAVFEEAAGLFRSARRIGLTVRSSVDCLIAACALRHNVAILHRDRDYPLLARVAPLKVRSA